MASISGSLHFPTVGRSIISGKKSLFAPSTRDEPTPTILSCAFMPRTDSAQARLRTTILSTGMGMVTFINSSYMV